LSAVASELVVRESHGCARARRRWYLVHTKPRGEPTALANLECQGYEGYFPRVIESGDFGRQTKTRVAPLFPGYMFLRLDEATQSLKPVHSTTGVAAVVRFGARYASVPDEVVTDLRARADPESGLHRLSNRSAFVRGMAIRITEGPFEGLTGIFDREAGGERALILLSVLGRQAGLQISKRAIVSAVETARSDGF
jgi:transcriptional antiterminator RfaH